MKDFDEPGSLAPTGLYLGGTKYMVIQGEPGAVIRGKKVFMIYCLLAMVLHQPNELLQCYCCLALLFLIVLGFNICKAVMLSRYLFEGITPLFEHLKVINILTSVVYYLYVCLCVCKCHPGSLFLW